MSESFRRVVDDLTRGDGCACHTGIGYNSSCAHCDGRQVYFSESRNGTWASGVTTNPDQAPFPQDSSSTTCNPAHLEPVTRQENIQRRHRWNAGERFV